MDRKLLFLGSNSRKFSENFSTTWTSSNYAESTWYNNFYNNWDWYAWYTGGAGTAYPQINGSELYAMAGQGGNPVFVNMHRTKENYNLNRNFKFKYSFTLTDDGSHPYGYSYISLSMCGNNALTSYGDTYGLELLLASTTNGSNTFYIKNNNSTIATPYSNFSWMTKHYIYCEKRGNTIYIATNDTGTWPGSYTYSYSLTNLTMQSSSLMCMLYSVGFQDYWVGGKIDDLYTFIY